MTDILEKVKNSLGITGNYQDTTLKEYIDEVIRYIVDAGVPSELANSEISVGVISRGVSDLWNYGEGKLSSYFYQRVGQLVYALESGRYISFVEGDFGIAFPVNVEGIEIALEDKVNFVCGEFTKECDVVDNYAIVTFTKEDSESFKKGTYDWNLKIEKADALITVFGDGRMIVS